MNWLHPEHPLIGEVLYALNVNDRLAGNVNAVTKGMFVVTTVYGDRHPSRF